MSALSAVTNAAATSAPTTTSKLVKLPNGEYTTASVNADPKDAAKLALFKQKDGNYGTTAPSISMSVAPAAQASSRVQSALSNLSLGGE